MPKQFPYFGKGVMTLRGYMDVITRTTFHLQARNGCGTDDQAESGPELEPTCLLHTCLIVSTKSEVEMVVGPDFFLMFLGFPNLMPAFHSDTHWGFVPILVFVIRWFIMGFVPGIGK